MELKNIFEIENEKPLDTIPADGGYMGIFRTVCCIGDSLSSGEFEAKGEDGKNTYHDMYEYSWGQYIARMCGSKVYNFSRGGMSAKWYCDTFADENNYWSEEYASQCYILALGVNEILCQNNEIGTIEDIDFSDWRNNKSNFAGYYAQIIQRMKEISPRAKFFLMTMANDGENDNRIEDKKEHADLLYALAEKFDNTYVIDLLKYAPPYNTEFRKKFYMLGHLNPMGYMLTAKMVSAYIDYIIRHNIDDFKEIGFIGTDLHA